VPISNELLLFYNDLFRKVYEETWYNNVANLVDGIVMVASPFIYSKWLERYIVHPYLACKIVVALF
jgi:hypothetical protein